MPATSTSCTTSTSASSAVTKRAKLEAFLPLGILLVAFVTIVASYQATFASDILEFQHGTVVTPPISMLMFAGPGRRYGQVGFPLVSLLFGGVTPLFYRVLRTAIKKTRQLQSRTTSWIPVLLVTSTLAFVCLAIVGAIPLQENLPLLMLQKVPLEYDSIIHQSAAAFFFLFSIIHMGTWLLFCRFWAQSDLPFYYKNSPLSFAIKVVCFGLCFFPLPTAFLLHPISPLRQRLALSEADAGGITQYALVACVATFFASYSLELWQHALSLEETETRTTRINPNNSSSSKLVGKEKSGKAN